MPSPTTIRPSGADHDAFYADYVRHVPDGDVLATLESQRRELRQVFARVDEQRAERRYAEGKWSLKELVGHLADTERVFAYRALAIARGDQAPLPGMDQDAYAAASGAQDRPFEDLLGELRLVRESTLALFHGLSDAAWERRGTANGRPIVVRAIPWIVAGHERSHMRVVRERYLAR